MTAVELTLPFLGQRTYLHGTTLFDALRGRTPENSALSFKVSRRIESNRVRVEAGPETGGWKERPAASLAWKLGTQRGFLGVAPLPPADPLERHPYDEALVTRVCSVAGQQVRLQGSSPFSFVATLVPLYKVLLKSVHPMASPGQWMFTRLDLERHPGTFEALSLTLDPAPVPGSTLVRCRILIGERSVGTLYYSWVV
jgi:hypothetical protein